MPEARAHPLQPGAADPAGAAREMLARQPARVQGPLPAPPGMWPDRCPGEGQSMSVELMAPLRRFLREMSQLVDRHPDDPHRLVEGGAVRLSGLLASDAWLPDAFAQPDPRQYRQYLLYCDPQERFSVVSFVWGPGQRTPVHDHQVWGVVGVLRGAEIERRFVEADGALREVACARLDPGHVGMLLPEEGDIHQVANAFDDRVSVSIHVYGGNIGAVPRHVFDLATATRKGFISGYANTELPNAWQSVD